MATTKPTYWSLSKNPPISNYGTIADKRLTTITPQTPDGYLPLEVPSTVTGVANLYYSINTNGKVTYAQIDTSIPASDPRRVVRQFNNIQEIATTIPILEGPTSSYNAQTTELIKSTISDKLKARTDVIITKKITEPSPYVSAGGGTDAPAGSGASGSSLSALSKEQNKNLLNQIAQGAKARTNYEGNLKYPETYEGNDYLTIDMIRYIPNSNLGLGTVGAEGGLSLDADTTSELGLPRFGDRLGKLEDDTKKEASIAKFTLPIPSNLIDANPVEWTADALNPLQAYGAGAIGRILNSGNFGTAVGGEIKRAGNVLKGNADAAKTVLNNEIIKQILGVNTLTRSTGAIVNNNTELLFRGVGLRSFSFTFKMTPRSASEATIVRKIIRRLKQGMSVKRSSSGLFLASPNVFKLQFWYVPPRQREDGSFDEELSGTPQPHPYLPKLKVCALQNMSVNYMPDGSYMTYGDGSMIGYEMTLTFAEIDPIFDEDYDKLDEGKEQDSVIGY